MTDMVNSAQETSPTYLRRRDINNPIRDKDGVVSYLRRGQFNIIGLYSEPVMGENKVSGRKSVREPKLNLLPELSAQIFGEPNDAPEVHAGRVCEAKRVLEALGIRSEPKRDVLAEVLALALASEPFVPEIALDRKPLYRDRKTDAAHPERKSYDILDWMRAVWGDEMRAGVLTRAKLRQLDPSADKAIENYLLTKELPSDIDLPTRREMTDAKLARLQPEELRAAWRLTRAVERRRASPI